MFTQGDARIRVETEGASPHTTGRAISSYSIQPSACGRGPTAQIRTTWWTTFRRCFA